MKNKDACVLLLEDDPAQYALLSAYLEKEHYRVLIADCIKEFNSLIATEMPDLVLPGSESSRRRRAAAG